MRYEASALKEFRAAKGSLSDFAAVRQCKDPCVFTVLFEDTTALLGLFFAFLGLTAAAYFDRPERDGVASILIGVILAATAMLLARESKALLIGKGALPHVQHEIMAAVSGAPDVISAPIRSSQSSISADDRSTADIEDCVERVEAKLKKCRSDIVAIFVKPQTSAAWRERRAQLSN